MKEFLQKYGIFVILIGFGLLLVTQQKLIMPLIYNVVKSDLFLVESSDKGSQLSISTPLTDFAYKHCNEYIKSELDEGTVVEFNEKPINAWSLGNFQFVVNGELNVTSAKDAGVVGIKKYVCRIHFGEGEHQEKAGDYKEWDIEGLTGLESIGAKS